MTESLDAMKILKVKMAQRKLDYHFVKYIKSRSLGSLKFLRVQLKFTLGANSKRHLRKFINQNSLSLFVSCIVSVTSREKVKLWLLSKLREEQFLMRASQLEWLSLRSWFVKSVEGEICSQRFSETVWEETFFETNRSPFVIPFILLIIVQRISSFSLVPFAYWRIFKIENRRGWSTTKPSLREYWNGNFNQEGQMSSYFWFSIKLKKS